MHTLHPGILHHTIVQMQRYIDKSTLDIPEWESSTGRHISAGEFSLDDGSQCVMRPGDTFDLGYDDTRWFRATVTVPDCMDGEKVYFKADFGGEAIVRINGAIAGALSTEYSGDWHFRNEILIAESAKAGTVLEIDVEDTVCCGAFCDEAMDGAVSHRYTVGGTCLRAVDTAVEGYWFEVSTIFDALDCIDDEVIRERVYNALDLSLHVPDYDMGREAFSACIPEAERVLHELLGKINYCPQGEVIMAGHSHLDIAWLWTSRELVRKTARTFANNLALMEAYPDFMFTQSQAIVYSYMKDYYPELFERVREKVKSGQWEIVGNAWVEADTNLASGESLIRQLLYGRAFFMKEFGVSSDTYWLPDCFGFSWALPQIIKRSGMKYFITAKLNGNDTNPFPYTLCRWRAHSGDEVTAYIQKVGYQGEYDPRYIKDCWARNKQNVSVPASLGMFGYGDGGGGSTYAMLERSRYIKEVPGLPASSMGHTDKFFSLLEGHESELPVWDGEMYYENHRGTFTSQAFVKRSNRKGEFMLRNAELLASAADITLGKEYPSEKLEKTWKLLLTNQFHDILPGTSIHEVFDDVRADYEKMNALGRELIDSSTAALEAQIAVKRDSIIVKNPLSFPVSTAVSAEIPFESASVTDSDGTLLKSTVTKSGGKSILTFIARDVPAYGWKAFALTKEQGDFQAVTATRALLENELLRVELDENGLITSVFDKENDREVLAGKANLLTVFGDKPIHESAWNIEFDYQMKRWDLTDAESIEVIDASPVRGTVRIVRKFNLSTITQDISLNADSRELNFETTVDWHETEKMLKASFPVNIRNTFASYETAHGSITRPTHRNTSYDLAKFEVCAHKWADLSEGDYGVSILNDCKYGYDIHENNMRITLMRSPNCPDRTADWGVNTFTYSLYPHAGDRKTSKTVENAFTLNCPPDAVYSPAKDGSLPENLSFISFDRDNIVLDAFKRAEDGNGFILRVYESKQCRGKVKVKTFFPISCVTECNLMECDESAVQCGVDGFSFTIAPHEVKTFRIN